MEMSLEERRKFLNNYDKLVEMFGQELVDEGLLRYGMLYDLPDVPAQDDRTALRRREALLLAGIRQAW